MTPGPDFILACPHCGALSRLFTVTEADDANAVSWTDGWQLAPNAPRQPTLVRCRACAQLHWTGQAGQLGMIDPVGSYAEGEMPMWADFSQPDPVPAGTPPPPGWLEAELYTPLEEYDYLEALREGLAENREQELELRVHAWWRGNDQFRNSKAHGRHAQTEQAVENLERLVDMLEDGEHEMQLFRCEGLRHLGRFDDAQDALSGMCSDYELAREKFSELLSRRSRDLEILFQ